MEMQKYDLPRSPWDNGGTLSIKLPDSWEVTFVDIPADQLAPLDSVERQQRLLSPIASPPLHRLARGKHKAVILFDDLSRPTDIASVAPLVVEELLRGGVGETQITFIAALGAHRALGLDDFTKKLGKDIVGRFPVYNHTPYENCRFIGNTTSGLPLYINKEVLGADLLIGIGAILPHSFNGFGGGGKIVLPGVAGMESIFQSHRRSIRMLQKQGADPYGIIGVPEHSCMQADIDEALHLTGFNFLINLLPDSRGRTVELVAGNPGQAYRQGVELARRYYGIDFPGKADIVISNACAKVNEALTALQLGTASLKDEGGDMVLVADYPGGQIFHYLLGPCGREMGGRLWAGEFFPPRIKRGFLLSSYPGQRFGFFSRFIECRCWGNLWTRLQKGYGEGVQVIIYKDATMQYFCRDNGRKGVDQQNNVNC